MHHEFERSRMMLQKAVTSETFVIMGHKVEFTGLEIERDRHITLGIKSSESPAMPRIFLSRTLLSKDGCLPLIPNTLVLWLHCSIPLSALVQLIEQCILHEGRASEHAGAAIYAIYSMDTDPPTDRQSSLKALHDSSNNKTLYILYVLKEKQTSEKEICTYVVINTDRCKEGTEH